MTLYIHYNATNNEFAGFFHSEITKQIPVPNIEITEGEHAVFYDALSTGKSVIVRGTVIQPIAPVVTGITWDDVKRTRDRRLLDTDWTDSTTAKTRLGDDLYNKWQLYRQALRDVPQKFTDPNTVVWPTQQEFGISQ